MNVEGPLTGRSVDCEPILRALPAWFGIEEANQHYIAFVDRNPTFIAYDEGRAVGFVSIERSFAHSAEIYVMAVHPDHHRQGAGRLLLHATEAFLKEQGVRFLQVKTLSSKHPSPEYAQTRAFYLAQGFVPLEEFPELWGPHNPCLQLIKAL